MKQYLDLLWNILDNGVEKESGRANMPNTIGISHGVIRVDIRDGENFPLLTTKKMFLKGIIEELLWILAGDTNVKRLVDKDVNIWNGDGYRWYQKKCEEADEPLFFRSIETFIDFIKNAEQFYIETKAYFDEGKGIKSENFMLINHLEQLNNVNYLIGDLGKVYGHQWRNQNGVDQIKDIINGLKTNPYSRYHILDGWNKADFKDMALPPCHLLYQFIVRPISDTKRAELYGYDPDESTLDDLDDNEVPKFYLDLNMYQRSCDTFLGVPFNIASMSILLMIIAKVSNMVAGVITWIGGDTHLYLNHLDAVKEQLSREPYPLPTLKINKDLNTLEDILALKYEDFELINYQSHPTIKAELFTGYKK